MYKYLPHYKYTSHDDSKAYKQGRFIANHTNLKEKTQGEKEALAFDMKSCIQYRILLGKGKQDTMALLGSKVVEGSCQRR